MTHCTVLGALPVYACTLGVMSSTTPWTKPLAEGESPRLIRQRALATTEEAHQLIAGTQPSRLTQADIRAQALATREAREALGAYQVVLALKAREDGLGLRETGRLMGTAAATISVWERALGITRK